MEMSNKRAIENVQSASDFLAECGSGTLPMTFNDLNGVLAEIEVLGLRVAELTRALSIEREACARHIELIAADWRAAGADQKVWAAEYLATQIRDRS